MHPHTLASFSFFELERELVYGPATGEEMNGKTSYGQGIWDTRQVLLRLSREVVQRARVVYAKP